MGESNYAGIHFCNSPLAPLSGKEGKKFKEFSAHSNTIFALVRLVLLRKSPLAKSHRFLRVVSGPLFFSPRRRKINEVAGEEFKSGREPIESPYHLRECQADTPRDPKRDKNGHWSPNPPHAGHGVPFE